jgi:subtilisin family serine protease
VASFDPVKRVFTYDEHEAVEVHAESLGDDIIDWGLHTIMAPHAWQYTRGAGVKVAVLDTGIDVDHRDLKPNLKASANFTNSRYGAEDLQGHGTHCAGVIGACDDGRGIIGVAPEAELYAAKVLGDDGGGTFDSIINGIRWAMMQNVDVISMSLGAGVKPPQAFHETIKLAHAKGIILVAATGNENGSVCWPAMYDEVIAVSALNKRMDRANFSNYGIANEIIAPGVDILSTYKNGGYAKLSGTSMATPMVAAAAALYISFYKKRTGNRPTVQLVHEALKRATVDLGKNGKDEYFGTGLINLAKMF